MPRRSRSLDVEDFGKMIKKILFVLAALLRAFVVDTTNLAFTTVSGYSSFNKEMTFERLEGTSSS